MDYFTEKKNSFSKSSVKFTVSVDEKGRIIIPADVRKTLGINVSEKLDLMLLVSEEKIILGRRGDSCVS